MPKFHYKSCCYLYWYRHCSYPVCTQKAPLSLRCSCTNFSHWFARNEQGMVWRIDDTPHSTFQCWLGITAIKQEFSVLSVDVSSERQEKDFYGIQIKINGDERENRVQKIKKKKGTHTHLSKAVENTCLSFFCALMLFNLLMYTRKLRNKAYFDISKFTKYIIEGSGES